MEAVFLRILNMSITAGWLVLAVMLLRLVLKRAPKAIRCALWALVGIRLVLPFSFESMWSLLPSAEPIPMGSLQSGSLVVNTGIPVVDQAVNPAIAEVFTPTVTDAVQSATPVTAPTVVSVTQTASVIWVIGTVLMLLYSAVSYWRLRRRVAASIPAENGLWLCDNIETPFILGIFRPRIYIPSAMPPEQVSHVAAHERAHLQRRDHWWKPLGFLLLSIHWFNPLLWLAYILLCRDIELACDEKVIRDMSADDKKAYSIALLETSVPRRMIAACPLAFGEVGVKTRIRSVLHYKKPAFWLAVLAVVLCVTAAVCLLTDPYESTWLMGGEYKVAEVLYATPSYSTNPADYPEFCLTADYRLYTKEDDSWELQEDRSVNFLTPERFLEGMFSYKDGWTGKRGLPAISYAEGFQTENDRFYLFLQTKKGETLLAYGWEDTGERHQGASDDSNVFYLCRLENQLGEHEFSVDFIARSLREKVGSHVEPFAYWSHAHKPGYAVVGFHAGEGANQNEMPDMGYAVFETENGGYLLKDWQLCPGAAQTPSRIVTAGTAVLGDTATDANTYDVILSSNPYLHSVKRVYYKGDTLLGEAKYLADIQYSLLMLPWDAYPEANSVALYYYDEQGRTINPDTGTVTDADGTVVHQPSYTYGCGSWKVTLPGEYVHLLLPYNVSQEAAPGHFTLTTVYEKASVEEAKRDFGSSDGMGFLFGITMLEGDAYREWLDQGFPGYTLFARDDVGHYFFLTEATDVQYYRSDYAKADYTEWERLMALTAPVCESFISLNGLTPCTQSDASLTELPQTLTLSMEDYTTFAGDPAVQLRVTNAAGVFLWQSTDPAVASVDASGKVTPVAPGTAWVYATDGVGIGRCTVRVREAPNTWNGPVDVVNTPAAVDHGVPPEQKYDLPAEVVDHRSWDYDAEIQKLADYPEDSLEVYDLREPWEATLYLRWGNAAKCFDGDHWNTGGLSFQHCLMDADGDGVQELAVIGHPGTGTDVSVDSLHIFQKSTDGIVRYTFAPAADVLRYTVESMIDHNNRNIETRNNFLPIPDGLDLTDFALGNLVHFSAAETGITGSWVIQFVKEGTVFRGTADYAVQLTADIHFSDGTFTLDNFRLGRIS